MKHISFDDLKVILGKHAKWLSGEDGGERANLQGADLQGADLQGAYLQGAYLQGAYLQGAYLQGAYLQGAYLQGADLQRADLRGADLQGAKNLAYQIPQEGELIVWKKIAGKVIKLRIPPDARRTGSIVGRKCRSERAEILSIDDGSQSVTGGHAGLTYSVGETVTPDFYDPDPRVECSHGIHFFLSREEAEAYEN